ncbi:unnamed protein product [Bursaphelenchus xylophilus]|uniref:(pine wood nematode) hypothetical protein n=1 Tax=Bursaphelenchus xylophilus TaxID=6326 RepID=A0A1I7RVN4_BURXY|nr:unnamed protein product [Bursaphelenchus xylophilus]CAG9081925.1 unnamed protein product [Bursaphelenchus xylophilus]
MSDSDEELNDFFEDREGELNEQSQETEEIFPLLPQIASNIYGDEDDEEEQEEDYDSEEEVVFADFDGISIIPDKVQEDVVELDIELDGIEQYEEEDCRIHQINHSPDTEHVVFRYGNEDFFKRLVTERSTVSGIQLDIPKSVAFLCAKRREPVFFSGPTGCGKSFLAMLIGRTFAAVRQHVIFISSSHNRTLSSLFLFQSLHKFNDSAIQTTLLERKGEDSYIRFVSLEQFLSDFRMDPSFFEQIGLFILDDFDGMVDPNFGGYWRDVMGKLLENDIRRTAGFLFLTRAYQNVKDFGEYFAKNSSRNCHVITAKSRPFDVKNIICSNERFFSVSENLGPDDKRISQSEYIHFAEDIKSRVWHKDPSIRKLNNLEYSVATLTADGRAPVIILAENDHQAEFFFTQLASRIDLLSLLKKERLKTAFKMFVGQQSHRTEEVALINNLFPLIVNGFGLIHSSLHNGLVEVTQTCFRRGLLGCLIMTRQSADRGINKARSVIIPSVHVKNGRDIRLLTPVEVENMTHLKGFRSDAYRVFIMDSALPQDTFEYLITPQIENLKIPEFKTFASILDDFASHGPQTLKSFTTRVIDQSFIKFDTFRLKLETQKDLKKLEARFQRIGDVKFEDEIKNYKEMLKELDDLDRKQKDLVLKEVVNYLGLGRLIRIKTSRVDLGWAVVIGLLRRYKQDPVIHAGFFISEPDAQKNLPFEKLETPAETEENVFVIRTIPKDAIFDVSTLRLKLPITLMKPSDLSTLGAMLKKLIDWDRGSIPLLRLQTEEFKEIEEKRRGLVERIEKVEEKQSLMDSIGAYDAKKDAENEREFLNRRVEMLASGVSAENLEKRVEILKKLGFLQENGENLIEMTEKAENAKGILLGDEILLLELIDGMEKYQKVFGAALLEVFGGFPRTKKVKENEMQVDDEEEQLHCECVERIKTKVAELEPIFSPEDPTKLTKNYLMWDVKYGSHLNTGEYINSGAKNIIMARINGFLKAIEDEFEFDLLPDQAELPVYLM